MAATDHQRTHGPLFCGDKIALSKREKNIKVRSRNVIYKKKWVHVIIDAAHCVIKSPLNQMQNKEKYVVWYIDQESGTESPVYFNWDFLEVFCNLHSNSVTCRQVIPTSKIEMLMMRRQNNSLKMNVAIAAGASSQTFQKYLKDELSKFIRETYIDKVSKERADSLKKYITLDLDKEEIGMLPLSSQYYIMGITTIRMIEGFLPFAKVWNISIDHANGHNKDIILSRNNKKRKKFISYENVEYINNLLALPRYLATNHKKILGDSRFSAVKNSQSVVTVRNCDISLFGAKSLVTYLTYIGGISGYHLGVHSNDPLEQLFCMIKGAISSSVTALTVSVALTKIEQKLVSRFKYTAIENQYSKAKGSKVDRKKKTVFFSIKSLKTGGNCDSTPHNIFTDDDDLSRNIYDNFEVDEVNGGVKRPLDLVVDNTLEALNFGKRNKNSREKPSETFNSIYRTLQNFNFNTTSK